MHVASPIPKKRARIEIIPLIDIMFFLLASFMMVSLSQTHMKGIKVNLPAQGAPPTTVTKDYVAIRVSPGNAIFFDGQFVQDDQVLSTALRQSEYQDLDQRRNDVDSWRRHCPFG